MPSVNIDLGKYVTTRPRRGGTFRVFFQVPARLRPSAWPSLIPIPRDGERTGDLSDAGQVAAIQLDASRLYAELIEARAGSRKSPGRTFDVLIRHYQRSEAWLALRPKTQKTYTSYLNHIRSWAATTTPAQPDPGRIVRRDVDGLLGLFDGHPVTKKHTRKQLRLLMETARALGWRTDNPCDGIRLRTPKSHAAIWEQDDVDIYVKAADSLGYASISLIILLEWEIGQRLTDVRGFRQGAEYDAAAGAFRFWQSKTGSYVTIPVSIRLRQLLAGAGADDLFMFRNERTGKAYTEERLSKTFGWVRNAAVKAGARPLLLRWLRHSCVVQLARKDVDIPGIASITGHTPAGAAKILATYLPRDNRLAWAAQEKRGLIG